MAMPSKPGSENRRFIAYSVRSQTCSEWRATRICLQYESVRFAPILLRKSKVASVRIFGEILKREAIADSDSLSRVTEVAYEFNTRR